MNDPTTIRRLYGRRQGHPLRDRPAQLVADLLPMVAVPASGPITAEALFDDDRPLALEIGFGKGEHVAFQARHRPNWGFIGCEPFLNGVAGLLSEVDEHALTNVRVYQGDAIEVLERLPDASLSAAYLLHPDPWPKARHAKRRFINTGPLDLLAAKLRPGAEFRVGTDDPTYGRWALQVMGGRTDFAWTAERPADWTEVPPDWPDTRYATKARRAGREVWRFRYVRT